MSEKKMPALPLFTMPAEHAQAIFICKVLLSVGEHDKLRKQHQGLGPVQHEVRMAARVYPHLLVHVIHSTAQGSEGNGGHLANQPPQGVCARHTGTPTRGFPPAPAPARQATRRRRQAPPRRRVPVVPRTQAFYRVLGWASVFSLAHAVAIATALVLGYDDYGYNWKRASS
jgi:hypothetical protein